MKIPLHIMISSKEDASVRRPQQGGFFNGQI